MPGFRKKGFGVEIPKGGVGVGAFWMALSARASADYYMPEERGTSNWDGLPEIFHRGRNISPTGSTSPPINAALGGKGK